MGARAMRHERHVVQGHTTERAKKLHALVAAASWDARWVDACTAIVRSLLLLRDAFLRRLKTETRILI